MSEKSFSIKRPKRVPLKSDKSTFRVYSAKIIARSDGKSESQESSI